MLNTDQCFCDGSTPIDLNPEHPLNVIVKDYSNQPYQEVDEKDFEVKTIADEQIVNPETGLDNVEAMDDDLYNFGDEDDLPDSDREMENRKIQKDVE